MDYQRKLTKIGSKEETLASILRDPKEIFGLPKKQMKQAINSKLLEKQKDENYGGSRAEHIRRTATPNTQALKSPSPQEEISKYKFLNEISKEKPGEKQVTLVAADYSIPLNQRRRSSILDQETQVKIDQMKEVFRQYEDDDHEDSGYEVSSPDESVLDQGLYRNHTYSSKKSLLQTHIKQKHFRDLQQKRLKKLKCRQCIQKAFCRCRKGIKIQSEVDDEDSVQTTEGMKQEVKIKTSFLKRMNSQIYNDNFVYSKANAQQNWKKVKQRVIQHLKMKRMVDFLSVYKNDERQDSDEELLTRCQRLMIHPQNKKLQYWNYFLSLIILLDILYIINIMFQLPQDDYHEINILDTTIVVFIIDFILNFFKINNKDVNLNNQHKRVWIDRLHIFKRIIIDLLALFPFQLVAPDYTFLKFVRIFRFSQAVSQFLDLVEHLLYFISNFKKRTMKNISSLLKLFLVLGFVCHFLACCWLYIGQLGVELTTGWMVRLYKLGTLDKDYQSHYIASIYYIFATLSTVGYGDIVGTDGYEYAFQIVVQIIGIGFFAYVMGNLHNILASFSFHDPTTFQIFHKFVVNVSKDEGLDQWMIQLDRAYKEKILDQELFSQTQTFFNSYSTKSLNTIKSVHFFRQLKPRLQNQLLDTLFSEFYEQFDFVFKGTEESFRRDIFKHLKFKMFQKSIKKKSKQNVFFEYRPSIFMKGDKTSHLYFIVKGNVYFTNESGAYTYFQLSNGSYFADSNILFNYPTSYSAFYDEDEGPLQVLRIKRAKFLKICEEFPSSKMVMERRAQDRRHKFRKYKIKALVKVMKSLVKMYYTNKESPLIQKSFVNRQRQVVEIYKALLSHFYHMAENYEIMREAYNEKQHRERFEDYKDRAVEGAALSMQQMKSISPEIVSRNGPQEMQQLDFASQIFGSFQGRNSRSLSRSTVRPSSKSVNPIYQISEPIPVGGSDMKKFMNKRMTQLLEESVTLQLEEIQEYQANQNSGNNLQKGDYYTMGMINEESKSRSSDDFEEEIEQVEEFREDQQVNSQPLMDNRKFSVLTITAVGGAKIPQIGNNSGSTAMLNFSTARDSQFRKQNQQQLNQQLPISEQQIFSTRYKEKIIEQTKAISSPKSLQSNKALLNKLKQQRQRTQRDSQEDFGQNLSLQQKPLKQITETYNFSDQQILMTSSRRETEGQLLSDREKEEEKQQFKRFMDDDIHLTESISISQEEDEDYHGNMKINLIEAEGQVENLEPSKQQQKMRILFSDSPNFEKYPPFSNQDIVNQNQQPNYSSNQMSNKSQAEAESIIPLRQNISTVLEEDSLIGISTPSIKDRSPIVRLKSEAESQIQIEFYDVAGSTGGAVKDLQSQSQQKSKFFQSSSAGTKLKQEGENAYLKINLSMNAKEHMPVVIEHLEILKSNEQSLPLTAREQDPMLDMRINDNGQGGVQKLQNSFHQQSNRNNMSQLKPSANTTKGRLSKKSSQELKYIMQEQELYQKLKSQKLPFDVYKNEIVCEYLYNSEDEYPDSRPKDNNSHHLDDQFKVVINGGSGVYNSQVSIPIQKQVSNIDDGEQQFIYPENQKLCTNLDSFYKSITEEFEKAKEKQTQVQINMTERLYLLRLQTRQNNMQFKESAVNQQNYQNPMLESQSIRR